MLTQRQVILVKSEVTHQTDSIPVAATDAVCVEDVDPTFPPELIEARCSKGSLGPAQPLVGRVSAGLTFTMRLHGSGTAGDVSDASALLKACGLAETVNAGVDVIYAPAADPNDMTTAPSVTIYVYVDGIRYTLLGCRGTVTITATAGQQLMAEFEMVGLPAAPVDEALPAPTLSSVIAPIVQGASLTIGGFSPVVQELTLGLTNVTAPTDSVNGAGAYGDVLITDRDPQGTVNPEQTLVAARDWWASFVGNTLEQVIATIGSDPGNTIKIDSPLSAWRDYVPGDRNGQHILTQSFSATESSALNDQILITYT